MSHRIPATIVNHVAIDIAAAADAVWGAIIEEIVEAKGFRAVGTVMPLDGPAAPLGGLRLHLHDADGSLDERIVHFTERDDAARRLSIFADFLSVPGGMKVYASYHAQETPDGARFAIDCHASVEIDVPVEATGAYVAAMIAEQTANYDEALAANLQKVRKQLQGDQR